MAIRLKNIDLNAVGLQTSMHVRMGGVLLGAGTSKNIIAVAPVACVLNTVTLVINNGFSANTSDTVQFKVLKGLTTATVMGTLTIATSAASNAYLKGQSIVVPITLNNSLTAGTPLSIHVSCVCQAVPSRTSFILKYTPSNHKEIR